MYTAKEQRCLGNDDFVESMILEVEKEELRAIRVALEHIEEAVSRKYDLSVKPLTPRGESTSKSVGYQC